MSDMNDKNQGMMVYSQQDMQMVLDFVDSLQYRGVTMARKVGIIASILESGKSLGDYMKKEGENDGGI